MIEFPFIGGTYPDSSFSSQRTVNMYPESDEAYKTETILQGFPGYSSWLDLGDGPVRAMATFLGKLIVIARNTVYSVSLGGSPSKIGSIGTTDGFVSIDENGIELIIVDGVSGYLYNGATFSEITDTTFQATNATHVTHMDSFFIVNQKDSGSIWVSNSFDGATWSASRTATAEFKSDHVIALWSDRELMLGGDKTTQVYYNSGASPMPFEAIRTGRIIYGVAAPQSVAIVNNTSHFLAQDANGGVFVARMNGYTVERVSTRTMENLWAGYTDFEDAFAMAVHWRGHEFYVLTFDKADTTMGRTFVFDASTGMWFELGPYQASIGDFSKWPVRAHAFFNGMNIVGDSDGTLHKLSDTVFTFNGTTMIALRRAPIIHQDRQRMFVHKLQLDLETGTSTVASGTGSDPLVMLDISEDGGRSWKSRTKKIGATGDYTKRVQFHQLGSAYDLVFQVSISDPVPRKFLAGYVS